MGPTNRGSWPCSLSSRGLSLSKQPGALPPASSAFFFASAPAQQIFQRHAFSSGSVARLAKTLTIAVIVQKIEGLGGAPDPGGPIVEPGGPGPWTDQKARPD